jgi:membrane-associated phospholipid phosphatase
MPFNFASKIDPFYRHICAALAAVVVIGTFGCSALHIYPEAGQLILQIALLGSTTAALPLCLHDRGHFRRRDAAATIPLFLTFAILIPVLIVVAARSGAPLRDSAFARIDAALHVNVPAFSAWAMHRRAGRVLEYVYWRVTPFVALAAFAPAIAGRATASRRFLLANLYAFALALPLFAIAPAVGPWYPHSSLAMPMQSAAQQTLIAARTAGTYRLSADTQLDIISFPSFHVIWAVLAAAALSTFRRLRIVVWIFAICIIVSTVTTGWHYTADVIGGILVAALAWRLASHSCEDQPAIKNPQSEKKPAAELVSA